MDNNIKQNKTKKKFRRIHKILLVILIVIIGIRIALPYIVLHFANKQLASMENYYGHIDDIDLSLYRGAYQVEKIYLNKLDKGDTVKFVSVHSVDLSIEWKAIFKGSIVGKISIDSARVQITKEKNDVKDIVKDSTDFKEALDHFMPIKINKLTIHNSEIVYRDYTSSPQLDLHLTALNAEALNLANAYDSTQVLPATINLNAHIYEGTLVTNIKLDPYAKNPTFDLNVSLDHTNLVKLNDFLKVYGEVDVNKGSFGLFSEVASKNGQFEGYVKPIIKDLDVVVWEKEEGNFAEIAWESLVGGVAWVFKNHKKDQLGTKVYMNGSFKDPNINLGKSIYIVLVNAFIKALQPAIDKEISLSSIQANKEEKKGIIEKLFVKNKN